MLLARGDDECVAREHGRPWCERSGQCIGTTARLAKLHSHREGSDDAEDIRFGSAVPWSEPVVRTSDWLQHESEKARPILRTRFDCRFFRLPIGFGTPAVAGVRLDLLVLHKLRIKDVFARRMSSRGGRNTSRPHKGRRAVSRSDEQLDEEALLYLSSIAQCISTEDLHAEKVRSHSPIALPSCILRASEGVV